MLKGKWALVTGATAALGPRRGGKLCCGAGANIVLHDLVEPRGNAGWSASSARRRCGERCRGPVAALIHRNDDDRVARPISLRSISW